MSLLLYIPTRQVKMAKPPPSPLRTRIAVQIPEMADTQLSAPVFPVSLQPPLVSQSMTMKQASKNSCRKPFSSVAPARLLQVSRLQIQLRLETIHEEETANTDDETSSAPLRAFLSSQTQCFFEVTKSSSSYEAQRPVCLGN